MRSGWIGVGWVLFASVGMASAQSITYQRATAPAGTILRDLSTKLGVNLLTSPQTDKELLMISLKDAPAKVVLDRIAWAVSGSWKREGTDLRLIRSASDVADEKLRTRRRVIQNFAIMLADQRIENGKLAPFSAERAATIARKLQTLAKNYNPTKASSAGSDQVGNEAPFERAVNQIATTLSPADFADLPEGRKVVFSSDPTPMQRPLPREVLPVLEELRRNQAIWADVTEKIPVTEPEFNGARYRLKGMGYTDAPPAKWGKVLLTVTRQPLYSGASMNLILADPTGKKVAEGYSSLTSARVKNFGNKMPVPSETDPEVKSNRFAEAFMKGMSNGQFDALPPDLQSKLLSPESTDPLALTFGELLVNYADAKKTNLIVALDDTTFLFGVNVMPKLTASVFDMVLDMMFESDTQDGCMAARPIDTAASRRKRLDRQLLGQYVRRVAQVKEMTIEESAQWLTRFPEQSDESLLTALMRILTGRQLYTTDPKWLRFYGSLTAGQRKAAQGDGLLARELTVEQADLLDTMVYGERTYLNFSTRPGQSDIYNTILQEPTESLPNGVPPAAEILITERSEDALFSAGSDRNRGYSPMDLAWQIHAGRHPDQYPWMKDQPALNLASLSLGKRVTVQISVSLTDRIGLNTSLVEPHVLGAKTYSFDTLPDAIKTKINEHLKSYESMPETRIRSEGSPTPVQP